LLQSSNTSSQNTSPHTSRLVRGRSWLIAIRSFFHVVALRDPASVGVVNRVLAIPRKRTDKRLVGYLTREEIGAVLAAPDQSTWIGRRDYALLLTMYNSGARLSEMTCMRRGQVKFDSTTCLLLGAPIQGRRYTVGLSRLALIFRAPLNETQA
jgi:site-specific recombinase XerD